MTREQATTEATRLQRMGFDVHACESPILNVDWEIQCADGREPCGPDKLYGLHVGDATRLCLAGLVRFATKAA